MRRIISLLLAVLLCLLLAAPALAHAAGPVRLTFHGASQVGGPYTQFADFNIAVTVGNMVSSSSIDVWISVGTTIPAWKVTYTANDQYNLLLPAGVLNQLSPGTYEVRAKFLGDSNYQPFDVVVGSVIVNRSDATVSGEFVHTGDMGKLNSLTANYTLSKVFPSAADPLNCFLSIDGVPSATISRQVTGGNSVSFDIPADVLNKLGTGTYRLSVSCSGNALTASFSASAGRIIIIAPEGNSSSYKDLLPSASVSNPFKEDGEDEDEENGKKIRLANGTTLGLEEIQALPQTRGMYLMEVPASTTSSVATVPFGMLQDLPYPVMVQTTYGGYVLSKSLTSHMPEVADNMRASKLRWADMQADLYMAPARVDNLMQQTLDKYGIETNRNFSSLEFSLTVLGPGARSVPTSNTFTAPVRRYISVSAETVSKPDGWGAFLYQPETQTLRPVSQRVVEIVPGQKMVAIDSYSNSIYLVTQRDVVLADVPADDPAYPYISRAVAKALMDTTEEDNFEPEEDISRAEFVQLFTNILYMPQATPHPYIDVVSSNVHDAAIGEAKTAGWLELLAPGQEFLPDQPITREETLGILQAILEQNNVALPETTSEALAKQYSDYVKVSAQYMAPLASVDKLGLLPKAADGTFSPTAKVTRAQAAEILIRTLVAVEYLDE